LQGIDQGLAGPVVAVQLVQARARDQKRRYRSSVVLDPDPAQITPVAQKERTPEDICGLKAAFHKKIHPLFQVFHVTNTYLL
jgi:hypothetical protein